MRRTRKKTKVWFDGNKKRANKNYKLKITLIAILMTFIVGLVTYGAFFTTQSQTEENQIASGCFDTSFTDSNVITLSGGQAFPMRYTI